MYKYNAKIPSKSKGKKIQPGVISNSGCITNLRTLSCLFEVSHRSGIFYAINYFIPVSIHVYNS